jgi:hypothetical protein
MPEQVSARFEYPDAAEPSRVTEAELPVFGPASARTRPNAVTATIRQPPHTVNVIIAVHTDLVPAHHIELTTHAEVEAEDSPVDSLNGQLLPVPVERGDRRAAEELPLAPAALPVNHIGPVQPNGTDR